MKYTILAVHHTYGHICEIVEKEKVREECERLRKIFSYPKEKTYTKIEVINNETGEVREYWNNSNNKLKF